MSLILWASEVFRKPLDFPNSCSMSNFPSWHLVRFFSASVSSLSSVRVSFPFVPKNSFGINGNSAQIPVTTRETRLVRQRNHIACLTNVPSFVLSSLGPGKLSSLSGTYCNLDIFWQLLLGLSKKCLTIMIKAFCIHRFFRPVFFIKLFFWSIHEPFLPILRRTQERNTHEWCIELASYQVTSEKNASFLLNPSLWYCMLAKKNQGQWLFGTVGMTANDHFFTCENNQLVVCQV